MQTVSVLQYVLLVPTFKINLLWFRKLVMDSYAVFGSMEWNDNGMKKGWNEMTMECKLVLSEIY